jgi:O-antigen/teichoic acid export membrane protein
VLSAAIGVQAVLAYLACRRLGLTAGRARMSLARPMARYGVSQLAAMTPMLLNGRLDQLVLSLAADLTDLGRYAVAVTVTTLTVPVVSAVGNVAFPRLASRALSEAGAARLQRMSILVSAGIAVAVMIPTATLAAWLVPAVFGEGFRAAVPLVWILGPGGVFLACGQVCGDLLRGQGAPLAVARAEGAGVVATLILLVGLLPVLGITGAAIASTVSYGVTLGVLLWSLRRLPPRHRDAPDDQAVAGVDPPLRIDTIPAAG